MVMNVSGPPWVVDIPSPVSGAGKAGLTYTLAGSSISAYCHAVSYPTVTFEDRGGGIGRCYGTKIARTYRTGVSVRVGGHSDIRFNQFDSLIIDHDTSTTMGWFDYRIDGPYSPVVTTVELTAFSGTGREPDSSTGYGAWMRQALGAGWVCRGNFAISGGDTEQNVAVFDATHKLATPRAVVFDISTNDIYARVWSETRVIAAVQAMVSKILSIGAIPVVLLVPPRSSGTDAAKVAVHSKVNLWARTKLPAQGCVVVDPGQGVANGLTFVNQASTLLAANTGMLVDGVHFDRAGSKACGTLAAQAVAQMVQPQAPVLASNATLAAQANSLFTNAALAASPGTAPPTGFSGSNIPEGLSVSRSGSATAVVSSAARTVAADGDAYGNNLKFVVTSTANNDGIDVAALMSLPNPGDTISSGLRLKVQSITNLRALVVTLRIRYPGEDGVNFTKQIDVLKVAGGALNDSIDTLVQVPDMQAFSATQKPPGAPNQCTLTVSLLFSGAGGADLTIAQPSAFTS